MRYTVYVADPSGSGGFSIIVVSEADFAELRDANDQLVRVVDLNDGVETWLNRHRVIRITAAQR